MINRVYRLISPREIVTHFEEINYEDNKIIVKPIKLSICAADQRYFTGKRDIKVIKEKLPMSLIHEAIGKVICDPQKKIKKGQKVVMIPSIKIEEDDSIEENYLPTNKFRSSGFDGFAQDYISMDIDRVVPYFDIDDNIACFIELISVAMHAIKRLERRSIDKKQSIGVWGDGNLGFIIALILKYKYKNSKIIVFGKNIHKLSLFSFADERYMINEISDKVKVNHAFEAVGGNGSCSAIKQIIETIEPEGSISLLGVSENPVELYTRKVLEKGITIIGNSRSSREDFIESIKFLEKNKEAQNQLYKIISCNIEVNSLEDLNKGFEEDLSNQFKTILDWNL